MDVGDYYPLISLMKDSNSGLVMGQACDRLSSDLPVSVMHQIVYSLVHLSDYD